MNGDRERAEGIKYRRTLDRGGNNPRHVLNYQLLFLRRASDEAFRIF